MKSFVPNKFMSIGDTNKSYNTIGLPEFLKLMKDFDLNICPSNDSSDDNPEVLNSKVSVNKKEVINQQRTQIKSTSSVGNVSSTIKNKELLSKIYAK